MIILKIFVMTIIGTIIIVGLPILLTWLFMPKKTRIKYESKKLVSRLWQCNTKRIWQ